uniref:RNA-directed DNA polymerase n=1 Tax=Tanacetum cinerariifolium TaxID=118510 RepID=A0A699GGT1_TANCI|nr:reverse transcriptase domain-containing protein [Tanacetum cinerariifolium]
MTMDQVHISSSGSVARVPSLVIQISPASKSNEIPERNSHQPHIPYPSRLNKEKLQDKSDIQITKFLEIFKKLHFNITDLGEIINLMPLSIYQKLKLGELKPTRMSLELANRPVTYPVGIAEDVFVYADKFTFPADFIVVDYDVDPRVPLILGRPFLQTARALVDKCHFMVKEGIVLGYKISKNGIKVDRPKVDVIAKLPPPTTVKGIRTFLGHAGFYRRFIQDISKIARPMTHLLQKETPFVFSKECTKLFEYLKKKLTEASVLVSPGWDLPFEIMCDASYFVRHYTTMEEELLVMVYAFEKFWSYLVLSKTIVYTDHSALRKLWIFLKLVAIVPPEDIMALTTPPRKFSILVLENGVRHKLSTSYHPQTSGQVEVSNRGLKKILERTVGKHRAKWADKLDDTLWAFRTAFKTSIGCTPYKLVYRKACHLPIKLEYKAYWVLKWTNFELKTAGFLMIVKNLVLIGVAFHNSNTTQSLINCMIISRKILSPDHIEYLKLFSPFTLGIF